MLFEKLQDQICNAQNKKSGEMANRIFETYTNSVIPHGKHMFKTASNMDIATMCAYPSSKYTLPNCKCVLRCCSQCPHIDLPSPESYQNIQILVL